MTAREQILQLLSSLDRSNNQLALVLAESQKVDLSDFWNDLKGLHQFLYKREGIQYDWISLWQSDDIVCTYGRHKELPAVLFKLPYLKRCNLNGNDFETIPKSLLQLTKLEVLGLESNILRELPEDIDALQQLTSLKLSSNQLPLLPESIGNLKQLRTLRLDQNRLLSLPESIGDLTALKDLILATNNLEQLPDSICNLTNLSILSVDKNQLQKLPKDLFSSLKNLVSINLNHNYLSKSLASIGECAPTLSSFYIGFNQLKTLPEGLCDLQQIKHLSLVGNAIKELPAGIGKLKNLESLYLNHNPISKLPEEIAALTSLTTLNLANVPLKENEMQRLKALLPNCRIHT